MVISSYITSWVPINNNNKKKKIRPTYDEIMMKPSIYDEICDETYDVIAVKTVSTCLAQMKGCWDPECIMHKVAY